MCHRANEETAWQCSCGYEFGQSLAKVRVLLRSQRVNAWIALVILLALTAAALYAAVTGFGILPFLGFIVLVVSAMRSVRTLWITRTSMRQLANRDLPVATLHKD